MPKSKRCEMDGCVKKLKMHGMMCNCGMMLCAIHISGMDHPCTFDYKSKNKIVLEKTSVIIPKYEWLECDTIN